MDLPSSRRLCPRCGKRRFCLNYETKVWVCSVRFGGCGFVSVPRNYAHSTGVSSEGGGVSLG